MTNRRDLIDADAIAQDILYRTRCDITSDIEFRAALAGETIADYLSKFEELEAWPADEVAHLRQVLVDAWPHITNTYDSFGIEPPVWMTDCWGFSDWERRAMELLRAMERKDE